jgi:hypothetical protein
MVGHFLRRSEGETMLSRGALKLARRGMWSLVKGGGEC